MSNYSPQSSKERKGDQKLGWVKRSEPIIIVLLGALLFTQPIMLAGLKLCALGIFAVNCFFSESIGLGSRMRIKFWNNKIGKVTSEKGFTLLELIFVTVVTGILSSTLILPFTSSIKQGTRPEIYNTATYLAVNELEQKRKKSYPEVRVDIDTATNPLETNTNSPSMGGRIYGKKVVVEYVSYSAGSFIPSATPTEYIKVTATISNPGITNVSMWEILTMDFYNRYAN